MHLLEGVTGDTHPLEGRTGDMRLLEGVPGDMHLLVDVAGDVLSLRASPVNRIKHIKKTLHHEAVTELSW